MKARGIVSEVHGKVLILLLHNEFYEKEAIRAAAYKFTDRCAILVRPADNWEIEVVCEPMPGVDCDLEMITKEFCNEVLDQQVRLDLERRYGRVRELIVQQAFEPVKNFKVELGNDE